MTLSAMKLPTNEGNFNQLYLCLDLGHKHCMNLGLWPTVLAIYIVDEHGIKLYMRLL